MIAYDDDLRGPEGFGEPFTDFGVLCAAAGDEGPPQGRLPSAWLAELRRLLDASGGELTVAEASDRLGCCTRTLQRHLRTQGTTFRAEATAARGRSRRC
ncbi:MAG TPA: hypothetical protein VFS43_34555 [Polyangiaceae bacterium]|nr:hypothetical protein [Polyangiaceae bacterium]